MPLRTVTEVRRFPSMPLWSRRDEDGSTSSGPVSPGTYWFPLILVVFICAAYLIWSRRNGPATNRRGYVVSVSSSSSPATPELQHRWDPASDGKDPALSLPYQLKQSRERPYSRYGRLRNPPAAVRLSMDDDGPAATSFIMNNGSNESLPSHALSDIPVLPEHQAPVPRRNDSVHPAQQSSLSGPSLHPSSRHDFPAAGFSRTGSALSDVPAPAPDIPQKNKGKGVAGRRSARQRGPIERTEGESDDETDEDIFGIGDDEDDAPATDIAGPLAPGKGKG